MLVLARQRDQTVMIGDDIEVTVVDIRGDKVRLGVNAPRSVSVHRKEVYNAIKKENQSAASANVSIPTIGVSTGPAGKIEPATLPSTAGPIKPDQFMLAAIDEARKSLSEGGLPIGSVLVRDGQIVARARNEHAQKKDPMAHAELACLVAGSRLSPLKDTILYSTLMPCYLCSGAVVQFGVSKVVVGESVNFAGGMDFLRRHKVDLLDLRDPECVELMRKYIESHPDLWHADIGR